MRSEEFYRNNKESLNTTDLRAFNMCFLHPNDERMCKTCRRIFEGIKDNFNIKKYVKGTDLISYNVECKSCQSVRNLKYRTNQKKTPMDYIKGHVASIRHRAKEKNLSFDLNSDYLIKLFYTEQNQLCYYTGEPLSFDYEDASRKMPHLLMASLERKDPDKGYIKGNVAWVIYKINRMKNELTEDQFYELCKTVLSVKNGR